LTWRIEFTRTAESQIAKLDRAFQARIVNFLKRRVLASQDPRRLGRAPQGDKKGLWRYRSGDFRIICDIRDENATVLVLAVAHRKEVYC
jgi:mRNA interferase RelE/StbE